MLSFLKNNKLVISILFLDILFVAFHYISNGHEFFNLDYEYNLPTLYQAFKLYTIFLMSVSVIYFSKVFKKSKDYIIKLFWLGMSTFFLYLSIDEVIQIHERITIFANKLLGSNYVESYESAYHTVGYDSANWLPFYIPVLLGGAIVLLLFFKKILNRYGKKSYLLFLTLFFFSMTFLMEYIGMSPSLNGGLVELWVTIEEGCEMVGATMMFWFVYQCLMKEIGSGEK